MVNRDDRNRLAELIRRYLDEDIMAFDFDEALDEFRESADDAVRFVSDALWYHYDDCDDHLVVLSKQEWNYFQRLLLLLESNSTVIDRSVANEPPPQSIYETGGHELRRWQGCINYAAVNRTQRRRGHKEERPKQLRAGNPTQ
jgi:hypothetical protein